MITPVSSHHSRGTGPVAIYNDDVPSPLRREIGQLLFGSLSGPALSPEFAALAREFGIGGVTLFRRNIQEPQQVAELSRELRGLVPGAPLWVAIDQEGGRVARLRAPFTEWPPMATLGRSGDPELCRRFAGAMATELGAVGVTLDYAPVLDVHTNADNPIIGDRAFSDAPDVVATLGTIVIEELQKAGVAACGKHFPGHGDTAVDSHLALPVVEHPPERIRAVECVPFRAAIQAGVAFMMTAHVLVPSMDRAVPATLSKTIVDGLLRHELGFEGVILSDDLEMRALADHWPLGEAAVLSIAAGCDAVLLCRALSEERHRDLDAHVEVLEALVHAVEDGRIPYARLDDALLRQRRARAAFLGSTLPPPGAWKSQVGTEAHQRIADDMRRYA